MNEKKAKVDTKKLDTKEFELPETLFVRDIENKVFQGIVLQCLSQIEGITLIEGNFIDSIFGRTSAESVKGIVAEQDNKNHCVNIKVEVNICYGVTIPEKAEEIQTKIAEEITRLTGLHVACVHVVFKNVIPFEHAQQLMGSASPASLIPPAITVTNSIEEEYTDEF